MLIPTSPFHAQTLSLKSTYRLVIFSVSRSRIFDHLSTSFQAFSVLISASSPFPLFNIVHIALNDFQFAHVFYLPALTLIFALLFQLLALSNWLTFLFMFLSRQGMCLRACWVRSADDNNWLSLDYWKLSERRMNLSFLTILYDMLNFEVSGFLFESRLLFFSPLSYSHSSVI